MLVQILTFKSGRLLANTGTDQLVETSLEARLPIDDLLSKVTVEYTDPSDIYPVISGDLQRHLPLQNLHWNSATRPLRSIASLHIDLVKAGTREPPLAADAVAHYGAAEPEGRHGALQGNKSRGSAAGAKKERRHQIPGLRQTPYLKLFFLRCSDVDSYRATYRKELREWIRDNTPPSQSTASLNTQDFHDAFEWLIVHIVLPDDGKSITRASNASKNDIRGGYRGSDAVTEKIRADFNSTSKTAVDRVAQVQITRDSERTSASYQNQDPISGWAQFVSKAKSLILSSFDLRVTQYEEDIKEKDAQRNIPGWNFNTFFVLKEGLARGFESVGLVEDALTGYQELAAGLSAIVENEDDNGQQQDLFKDYTDDLSMELKRVLHADQSQYIYQTKEGPAGTLANDVRVSHDRAVLGSNILDTGRKPFRELILANEISLFDFRCYLFAREITLLLRLACSSETRSSSNGALAVDDRMEDVDVVPEAAEPNSRDLLLLSEICWRAVNFFASAGLLIRDDLRASIDPLSKGHPKVVASSFSAVEDPIEDIVASWLYSACQSILDITIVPSLHSQLHALLRTLKPSDETHGGNEGPSGAQSREGLPQRTSSLPTQARTSPVTLGPESFPAVTSLDAMRLLPPISAQTGSHELAAQRAELVSLKRRVVTGVAHRSSNIEYHRIDFAGLISPDSLEMKEIPLDDTSTGINGLGHQAMTISERKNHFQNKELSLSLASENAYMNAYENLTTVALALNVIGERRRSAECLTADLAAVRFRTKNYISAASYFHQLATFYYNNDWTRLEVPMLHCYAQALKHLDRKHDFCRVGLQLLAKIITQKKPPYSSAEDRGQDSLDLRQYLSNVLNASKSLSRSLFAPLYPYFDTIFVDPYIHHYKERDGFHMMLKLQNQLDEALVAHEVRVKLVGVNDQQPCAIWLSTVITELLQPGPNKILVQTTTTCPGWYRMERIEIQSANIIFTYDKNASTSITLFDPPAVTDAIDQINEASSPPILVWSGGRALDAQISLQPSIHLGKPRSIQILISSSQNRISQGKFSLRAGSAGLRIHTADAKVQSGDGSIIGHSQAGTVEFGILNVESKMIIRIPYGLETDLREIKVKAEISYTVDGMDYFYLCNSELKIQLPLSVNVQDTFQDQVFFSNFKIDTANSIPARIIDYNVQGTRSLRVTMPSVTANAITIFAGQPLSLVAEIRRDIINIKQAPNMVSDEQTLMLKIRYACLDQVIRTTIEDALSDALRESQFRDVSRLLVGLLGRAVQTKYTITDLEKIGLLGEIHIAPFHHYDWDSVLDALRPEERAEITSWLTGWHAVIDPRNALDLTVPVEIPRIPVVVTARLEILGCGNGPEEVQFAAVDQTLVAEIILQYSRYWANEGSTNSDLEMTYEFQAGTDTWLIGGQRRASFTAKSDEVKKFTVVLLPQKIGQLQYPSIEIRTTKPQDNGSLSAGAPRAAEDIITCEVDYVNQTESILVIPNLSSSTVTLDSNSSENGAWLVEARSRFLAARLAIFTMSAVVARKGFVQALDELNSTSSSTTNSIAASPKDTPRQSPSTTSLSSLDSSSELELKNVNAKLLDTYGNEFQLPDFTIKQIRDAIPTHCFQRSGAKGLGYVTRDIVSLATTFYLFHTFVTPENVPSTPVRAVLWAAYTFVQGLFGTGLWVLAHECGHQSFSPSKTLNDTVGWFCHSALLVPYFSWKISHGKHHKATGHLQRDMVFVPKTRDEYASKIGHYAHELSELMEETPILTAGTMIGQQLVGWLLYISANVTGHNFHENQSEGRGKGKRNGFGGSVNHFDPSSPLYEAKDSKLILLSDLGLAITLLALVLVGRNFGWVNLAVWYFLPYLWVNHWLVAITFLQHTDPTLPHYEPKSWNFARGAAATIDREFGFIGRHLFHGIIETHVLHHFVSTIPFYNADEATEAIKPVMGQHYRSNVEDGPIGFLKSMWRSARMCQWIEPCEGAQGESKGVLFFRNRNGLGVPPQKMAPPVEPKTTPSN
ncbi:MAG: hypothetical protein Q9170_000825 [Blastenia crenularia]